MKKVKMSIGVAVMAMSLLMVSCGGVDGTKMGNEYCECVNKTDPEESLKCVTEWAEKYKDAKATESETKKAEEAMSKCIPSI
jgi:hypothetical protein